MLADKNPGDFELTILEMTPFLSDDDTQPSVDRRRALALRGQADDAASLITCITFHCRREWYKPKYKVKPPDWMLSIESVVLRSPPLVRFVGLTLRTSVSRFMYGNSNASSSSGASALSQCFLT